MMAHLWHFLVLPSSCITLLNVCPVSPAKHSLLNFSVDKKYFLTLVMVIVKNKKIILRNVWGSAPLFKSLHTQFGSINRQYLTKISAFRIVFKYKKLMHVFMICILIRHVKSPRSMEWQGQKRFPHCSWPMTFSTKMPK